MFLNTLYVYLIAQGYDLGPRIQVMYLEIAITTKQ